MPDPGAIDDPAPEDLHAAVARQLARLKLSTAPMQPTTDEARQRAAERQAEHDRLFELTDSVLDRARRLRSLGYPMEAEALERNDE